MPAPLSSWQPKCKNIWILSDLIKKSIESYEWWYNFYEFHKLAIDELDAFNYDEYKKNGFKMEHLGDYPLKLEKKPEA